ncbi:MAG: glutamate 5-kinase, partial [bacterium]|nr:glutamate 5-kinase [bacterium]
MIDLLRQEVVTVSSAVIKVGTRVLTHPDGTLNTDSINNLAQQICELYDSGKTIFLVSSGAVGAGLNRLKINTRPTDLAQLQAVAAVGQTRLIQAYDRIFRKHGRHAAQVLVTLGDFHDRGRYLNVRNTLLALQEFGAVAIVNENDTVAVDELSATFGDNDRLAALVTNALRAPLLVILSDVEGLYDGPPESPDANIIPT